MLGKACYHGSVTRPQKGSRSLDAFCNAHLSRFPGDQGEIRHRGSHQSLEQRLGSPKVARLAHPQLDHSRQAMFSRLSQFLVLPKSGAVLQRSCLLQQPLLRMQAHCPALARPGTNALRPQAASIAHLAIEAKGFLGVDPAMTVLATSHRSQLAGDLPGGADTGHRLQVNLEDLLGEEASVGARGHPGDQFAPRLVKGLPGVTPSP